MIDASTLKLILAAQTITQSALDALAIAGQLNAALAAQAQENRLPTSAELQLADSVFKGTDDELTAAILQAKAEGR